MQLHLQSFGTKLRVREGMFEIVSFTRDDKVVKEQFPVHQVDSIWMQKQTSVSSDAIMLAAENNVGIIILNRFGFPMGRFMSSKPSSTSLIQKNQLKASLDEKGLEFVKAWVVEKLDRQSKFIYSISRRQKGDLLEKSLASVARIKEMKDEVAKLEGKETAEIAERLRGLEGTAGKVYFAAINRLLPKRHRFEKRSRRPAQDAYNAFLNYAYAILYSRVEAALFGAGLNPYIGFLHRDDYNYQGLVFDYIEPYRVWMDKVVFRLFTKRNIGKKHFAKKNKGIWLSDEGKKILIYAINDFFRNKKENYRGKTYTPGYILPNRAKSFAAELKSFYRKEVVAEEESPY